MKLLIRWRWLFFGMLCIATAPLLPGVQKAAVPDNAMRVWFLETDPQLHAYDAFHKEFGNDEVILLQIHEPKGIFQRGALERIDALGHALKGIDGVDQVLSILTMKDVTETPEGIRFKQLLPSPLPEDDSVLQEAKARALQNPLAVERLLSKDGTRALFWIQMESSKDFDKRRDAIVSNVQRSADEILGSVSHPSGGIGVVYSALNIITQRDFGLFVGIGYILMFLALIWIFRRPALIAAALGVITVGTVVALGLYGLKGHQLNMVTVLLPTLVFVLGIADAVHFPAAFISTRRAHPGRPPEVQTLAALKQCLWPCVLTTITTMAGFLALATSPMEVIRSLGIYASVGIGAALIASIILMVLVSMRMNDDAPLPELRWISRCLASLEQMLHRRPMPLAAVTLGLIGLGCWGMSSVEADTYTLGYFPDDHEVIRDHRAIEEGWGPYFPLEFLVHAAENKRIDGHEILNATEEFIQQASMLEEVRNGVGLPVLMRRMEQVLAPHAKAHPKFTPELAAQLNLLLEWRRFEWDKKELAYKDNVQAPWCSRDGKVGRITLIGKALSAKEIEAVLVKLNVMAKASFGKLAKVEATGYTPLYVKIIEYVMTSQVRAFYLALVIIFLLMWVWLRSLRLALISVTVNVFPVIVMMGTMGALGLDLDIASATIAAIVLGVSIDDTIHFLFHWQKAEKAGLAWSDALRSTYEHAGKAAIITTTLLVIGYPVLMLADVKTVFFFGLLTTVAALAAIFADLIMLPLLLKAFPDRVSRTAS